MPVQYKEQMSLLGVTGLHESRLHLHGSNGDEDDYLKPVSFEHLIELIKVDINLNPPTHTHFHVKVQIFAGQQLSPTKRSHFWVRTLRNQEEKIFWNEKKKKKYLSYSCM